MKLTFKILLIFLLVHGWGGLYAQKHPPALPLSGQPLIDSILKELPKLKDDTNKAKLLGDLSFEYASINPDEGIKYADQIMELSRRLKWTSGAGLANNVLGANYQGKSDLARALEYFSKALKIAENDTDISKQAVYTGNIASVYYNQRNFPLSIEYYTKALKIREKQNNKKEMADYLIAIGNCYVMQNNIPKGEEYYAQTIKLKEEPGDKKGIANTYGQIAATYLLVSNYPKALENNFKGLEIMQEIGDKKGTANAYGLIAGAYLQALNYPKVLEYDFKGLKIMQEIGDKKETGNYYGYIGNAYNLLFKYPEALEYNFKALRIAEESNKNFVPAYLQSIGSIYMNLSNFPQALEYHFKALKLNEALGDKIAVASSIFSIGSVYATAADYPKALEYNFKALKMYEDLDNKSGIATTLLNIGNTYQFQGNYPKALEYNFKALKMDEIRNSIINLTILTGNNGECYLGIAKDTTGTIKADSLIPGSKALCLHKAIENLTKAIKLSRENGFLDVLIECSRFLSEAQALSGNYKAALESYKESIAIKDSIFSEQNSIKISNLESQRGIELKDKQIEIDRLDILKERNERWLFFGGIVFLLVVIGIVLKIYAKQKKTNHLLALEKQKSEIFLGEIQTKNRAITDNINYARRIQSAILPDIKLIYKTLDQSFILYLPKDVVSGDFYAFAEKNQRVLIIAGDCTGHGVSGAFMSMIGSSLLNQIINESKIEQPALILNQLNSSVIDTFRQSENESHDGMDVSICSFDLDKNELQYAGANRPLWLIRNNELLVFRPDKFPIGGLQVARERNFTNYVVSLQKNDTIYIFTDGYADQFGGENGKKLMTAKFKAELLSIQQLSMREQEIYLKNLFEKWRGTNEQVDDVLVIGVRV